MGFEPTHIYVYQKAHWHAWVWRLTPLGHPAHSRTSEDCTKQTAEVQISMIVTFVGKKHPCCIYRVKIDFFRTRECTKLAYRKLNTKKIDLSTYIGVAFDEKKLTRVGFEPTHTYVYQKAHWRTWVLSLRPLGQPSHSTTSEDCTKQTAEVQISVFFTFLRKKHYSRSNRVIIDFFRTEKCTKLACRKVNTNKQET